MKLQICGILINMRSVRGAICVRQSSDRQRAGGSGPSVLAVASSSGGSLRRARILRIPIPDSPFPMETNLESGIWNLKSLLGLRPKAA